MRSLFKKHKTKQGDIYLPISELADIFGYNHAYLSILAREGRFEAKKVQGRWFAAESSVRMYLEIQADYAQDKERPGRDGKDREFISLAEASTYVPYSQDYLSLLARKGKLPAKKIGRNWFTTREKVERYYRSRNKKNEKIFVGLIENIFHYYRRVSGILSDYGASVFGKRTFRMTAAVLIIVATFGLFGAFRFPEGEGQVLSGIQADSTNAFQLMPDSGVNNTTDSERRPPAPVVVKANNGGVLNSSSRFLKENFKGNTVFLRISKNNARNIVSDISKANRQVVIESTTNKKSDHANCEEVFVFGDTVFKNPDVQNDNTGLTELSLKHGSAVVIKEGALKINPEISSGTQSGTYMVYNHSSCEGDE